jgi:NAD(P)H-nitrite reductase large subunit
VRCPFCLHENQRLLGGIFLATAKELDKSEFTAGERACGTCLMLVAQLLDTWREGGINSFMARARSAGLVKELDEYVESGSRPLR